MNEASRPHIFTPSHTSGVHSTKHTPAWVKDVLSVCIDNVYPTALSISDCFNALAAFLCPLPAIWHKANILCSGPFPAQLKKLLSSVAWFRCSAVNRVNSGTFCTWFIRCFVQRRRGSLRASRFPYCGTAVETVLHSVSQLAVLLLLLSEGRNGQQDCLLLKCLRCQAVTLISAVIDRKA